MKPFSTEYVKNCSINLDFQNFRDQARGEDWATSQSALSISRRTKEMTVKLKGQNFQIPRYDMSRDTKWAQSTADFEVIYTTPPGV